MDLESIRAGGRGGVHEPDDVGEVRLARHGRGGDVRALPGRVKAGDDAGEKVERFGVVPLDAPAVRASETYGVIGGEVGPLELPGGGDADDQFERYCRRPRFRSIRTSLMTVLSVSKTPTPVEAAASISGTLRRLRSAWSSPSEAMFGRSRLLYWSTRGSLSGSYPCSRRFIRRFSIDSSFESVRVSCESAQKTTPSTPRRIAAGWRRRKPGRERCPGGSAS